MAVRADVGDGLVDLDARDARALTEYLLVEQFADGLFRVYSEDGTFQVVEPSLGSCECEDMQYQNPAGGCKHLRRVQFWTGDREIPDWCDRDRIDPLLLEAIDDV
jgi:hypothetical protein